MATYEPVLKMASAGLHYAVDHVKAHPYQTAITATSVAMTPVLGAGWLVKPVLNLIGFGALGPTAGSVAVWYQSSFLGAYIPPGSLFAMAQHAAMAI